MISSRPEFCYTVLRLLSKCETPKRRPLSHSIPGLCAEFERWRAELSRCGSEGRRDSTLNSLSTPGQA